MFKLIERINSLRIVHLCLSNFYYDNFSYQENLLVRQNIKDGHNVLVIASTESLDKNGSVSFLSCSKYLGSDGANVVRLPYNEFVPKKIRHKFRSYDGLFNELSKFVPNIIYFHGISAYELLVVKKYKILNPKVKFIVDVHSDKNNSATNWISKNFLHKVFYKSIFQSTLPYIDKVFCCSMEAMDFAIELYGAPKEKAEFYPLGGFCLDDQEYNSKREKQREQLKLTDNNIMLLQTGKFNKKKKLLEALENFIKVDDPSLVYIVAGSLEQDIKDDALKLISLDKRINYIGWVDAERIESLLCASDVYIQPGSQSATMQQSLCLRNPVVLDNVKSHYPFVKGNGWLIDSTDELEGIFNVIVKSKDNLNSMSKFSFSIAHNLLDYKKLAHRIYVI